jgi:hypothetical protein
MRIKRLISYRVLLMSVHLSSMKMLMILAVFLIRLIRFLNIYLLLLLLMTRYSVFMVIHILQYIIIYTTYIQHYIYINIHLGGIGNTLNYIDKLENVTKPVEINYKPINYN